MNKNIDISIIVKTYARPQCLDNFLESIKLYEKKHSLVFSEVIIIDDSPDEFAIRNKHIVSKYNNSTIVYKKFPEDSVALSKGRNIAVDLANSTHVLLCDDDFILDPTCDIDYNLKMLYSKSIDILGGYFRNISAKESLNYNSSNWLGFFDQKDFITQLMIYTNKFPRFTYCDITHNFFIAKKSALLSVLWNENLPMLEHNEFFYRAKIKGLKVAFSRSLYVRHLHLDNEKKTYNKKRNRTISYNQPFPMVGTLYSDSSISTFSDLILSDLKTFQPVLTKQVLYGRNRDKLYLNLKFIYIELSLYPLILVRRFFKTKLKFNYLRQKTINDKKNRLEKILKELPEIKSTAETLTEILNSGKSLCRFGDGEMKLIVGEGLGEQDDDGEYQIFNQRLQERLIEIITTKNDEVLIAINNIDDIYDDIQNYQDDLSYFENFYIDYWDKLKTFITKQTYYSTFVSRNSVFFENDIERIKKIWKGRKVLYVVGENSHFIYDNRLFGNIKSKEFIYAPSKSAFSKYEEIYNQITQYDREYLVMISLGPTATVLAYDLSLLGFQALDIGHLSNCYHQYLGEAESPEIEHWNMVKLNDNS